MLLQIDTNQIPSSGNSIIDTLIALIIAFIPVITMLAKQRGTLRKLVEQIQTNDEAQSVAITQLASEVSDVKFQVTDLQSTVSTVKTDMVDLKDISKSEYSINVKLSSVYRSKFKVFSINDKNLQAALLRAKSGVARIYLAVVNYDFNYTTAEFSSLIHSELSDIAEFVKKYGVFSLNPDFYESLKKSLLIELDSFTAGYSEIATTLTNSKRRKKFEEDMIELVKKCLILTGSHY